MRRPRRRWALGAAAAITTSLLALSGCGSGSKSSAVARDLAARVIPAPDGYLLDTTPGANGQISPALFARFGGASSAARGSFVAGFKANYVDETTGEGLSVTILDFSSPSAASAYLKQTQYQTLSFAAATYTAYSPIPGATEADGTKVYAGEYSHGVVMSRGRYYAQVVYVNLMPGPPPFEMRLWTKAQYVRLT